MDWTALRDEFPVTRRWAFFDHAAVAPLSGRARQALVAWAADMAENGDVNERQWVQRVEEVRRHFGQLLGCDPLDIAFVKNTSEGVGIVAEGFPWRSGENVVIAQDEYPANQYPWLNLARRGVETRAVASRDSRLLLDDVRAAIDGRTRIVSLSFELLLQIGVSALEQRILELTDYLCDKVPATRYAVYSSRLPRERSGIVSLTVPGSPEDLRQLVKRCRHAGIVVNRRAGRLRV